MSRHVMSRLVLSLNATSHHVMSWHGKAQHGTARQAMSRIHAHPHAMVHKLLDSKPSNMIIISYNASSFPSGESHLYAALRASIRGCCVPRAFAEKAPHKIARPGMMTHELMTHRLSRIVTNSACQRIHFGLLFPLSTTSSCHLERYQEKHSG